MSAEPPTTFSVELTPAALADLANISDKRTQQSLYNRVLKLDTEPLKQGKPLVADLQHYRSVRGAGQRYRIIYLVAISGATGTVSVVVIGIRKEGDKKDVYSIASKRLG
ncbi:type II toxin-antitoxin system RelE family toxin [Deinococcus sp.]|uniref:type II toxin-antitoxin system RelE family toxin n=1 Tax=Deinococcus sp. TaxID=47478 RepID=UPI003B59B5DA